MHPKPKAIVVITAPQSPLEELESISPMEEPSEEIKPVRGETRASEYVEKFGCGCGDKD